MSSSDDTNTTDWDDALIGVALAFFATIFSTVANVIIKYTTMQVMCWCHFKVSSDYVTCLSHHHPSLP
jgi:hypothetical protein